MNNTTRLKYALPLLLVALVALAMPQTGLEEQLKANLEKWRTSYAQEKVYVQHDMPYYAPGQEMWLKAYVLHASSLKSSDKSRVLYVDLLNASNQPVDQLTLKVENGKAHGDIILPEDLPEGVYRLVAYTQWMRNFGEHTFFSKAIRILGKKEMKSGESFTAESIDLQFFPEGGDWVTGITSRVAFKAITPDGRGISIAGAIFDDQGRKFLDFEDTHLGMGAFSLQPEEGRSYFAKVNYKDGSTIDYPLPQPLPEGYVLSIDENFDAGHLLLTITGNASKKETLILTGIGRDELRFSKGVKLKKDQTYTEEIDKDIFPTGTVRFNLARADGEPLAERLVFIDHKNDLNLRLRTNKTNYASREQVTLQIEAKDEKGKPVATDFSLAITDDQLAVPDTRGVTLKSYLLLTSDLKGFVEQPGYYFEHNDAKTAEALSYLLMTQGWRRFSWKEITMGNFPDIMYRNENSLSVKGKLITRKGEPVRDGEVILYLKNQHQSFIVTETNQKGEFEFEGFDFTDSIDIVVQGSDARGRRDRVEVKVDNTKFIPRETTVALPPLDDLTASIRNDFLVTSKNQSASVEKQISTYTLKEVMLKEVIIEGTAEIIAPFKLHGQSDAILWQKDLFISPSGNILESLQGRVAGLQVFRTGQNQFRASIRGQGPPLYLLDGVPVEEGTINSINQFDISRIEVLKSVASAGIYGGRAANGVIALYTKRGGEELVEAEPGKYIIVHRTGGFSKAREFYSPQYQIKTSPEEFPDLRTTLYWNPQIKTNSDGVATVTFFTADRTTTYRAIAEGVSEDGKPGREVVTFSVKGKEGKPY